jgi:hypothetical protein
MHDEGAITVMHGVGKWPNVLSQVKLVDREWSKCKHTHRCILHLDCSQREVGMFATLLHGGDENVRERERETVTLIVCIVSTLYAT